MGNRLTAIYNVWADSIELLPYSINCIIGHIDEIIVVFQNISNFGEKIPFNKLSPTLAENFNITYVEFKPNLKLKGRQGMINETNKRNLGLEVAKSLGCSHYCMMDSDEMWLDFGKAKQQYFNSGAKASVAQLYTYFKSPTLRFGNVDNYYIPFISVLHSDSKVGNYNIKWYCDPTRKPNESDVVLIDEKCHHFSWVRKDITLKVKNSSARENIYKSKLLRDYFDPNTGEGTFIKDFGQMLVKTENLFNIQL